MREVLRDQTSKTAPRRDHCGVIDVRAVRTMAPPLVVVRQRHEPELLGEGLGVGGECTEDHTGCYPRQFPLRRRRRRLPTCSSHDHAWCLGNLGCRQKLAVGTAVQGFPCASGAPRLYLNATGRQRMRYLHNRHHNAGCLIPGDVTQVAECRPDFPDLHFPTTSETPPLRPKAWKPITPREPPGTVASASLRWPDQDGAGWPTLPIPWVAVTQPQRDSGPGTRESHPERQGTEQPGRQ